MIVGLIAGLFVVVQATTDRPAGADGPASCTSGSPPYPYRGYCGTFNGNNTFYGSYGLGFPTPTGWGICAFRPGSGGAYPAPGYSYQLSGGPSGADLSRMSSYGYAISRGTAEGFWDGSPGAFTADQAAVGAKLLYDDLAWHISSPAMDPGVQAAYTQLLAWAASAAGATGPPGVAISLQGGGSTFTSTATIRTTVAFPGSGTGVAGVGVIVGLSNATFVGSGGATSQLGTTNSNGVVRQDIIATGSGPVRVTVTSIARVGELGVLFYRPTAIITSAQTIFAPKEPILQSQSATFTLEAPAPTTGTVSISKSGDDTAYYPIDGAQFQILDGATVLDTLVTDASGNAGPSGPLPIGTYTVHESVPPPGYLAGSDQSVTIADGVDTLVSFTGDAGNHIDPATIALRKVSSTTGEPLAGATLEVAYDADNDGTYETTVGSCTTGPLGSCTPPGNTGSSLLPGRYRISETSPPSGFAPDQGGPIEIELSPGQDAEVAFSDPPLVSQTFIKEADGNIDPHLLLLAGATFSVTLPDSTMVTSCTTDDAGTCTTDEVLIAEHRYCWSETATPPGLEAAEPSCFTAAASMPAIAIRVTDPGRYVEIIARKVDADAPSVTVPGAIFDLYRMDDGSGPTTPPRPTDASDFASGTWVARSTGAADGVARFALQLPDYAYCIIEQAAPWGYVSDPTPHCTAVLVGVTSSPPTSATITIADPKATTTLSVRKFNTSEPDVGVPNTTYDLYVTNPAPPAGAARSRNAPDVEGLTWWASGSTDLFGHLTFTIPVGYRWCLKERSAPSDFILDPGLHCTAVLTAESPDPVRSVAVSEVVDSVTVTAFKFNAARPGLGVPGATYALFVKGAMPAGFISPATPMGFVVPPGLALFAIGVSDARGRLDFSVPAGHAWCLLEVSAPSGYLEDPGLHCTAVLTHDTGPADLTVALPEVLAATGSSSPAPIGGALLAAGLSALLLRAALRRRLGR